MLFLKRIASIFVGIFISMIFVLHHTPSVFAYNDLSDPLDKYRFRLSELNDIFNTDYIFPSGDDISYPDMVDFYQKMTISEFDAHIYSLYRSDVRSKRNEKDVEQKKIEIPDTPPKASAHLKTQTQKYYYDKTNYLYVVFNIKRNTSGKKFYIDIKKTGEHYDHYPAYKVHDHSYALYNKKRNAFLTFDCVRYLSPYLIDTDDHHFSSIFEIGNGDVSASFYDTLMPIQIKQNNIMEFDEMEDYTELIKNKIYIYCFETGEDTERSLIDDNGCFEPNPFCAPQDGHYAIYMIFQDGEGNDLISDISNLTDNLISIKQYKDAEAYFRKTRKLSL